MKRNQDEKELKPVPPHGSLYGTPQKEGITVRFLCLLVLFLLFLTLIGYYWNYTYARIVVRGSSMTETLHDGDVLIANTRAAAERGDIIVVDVSDSGDEHFTGDFIIKRLIALEGDSIYCKDNTVYLRTAGTADYVALTEEYLSDTAVTADFAPITVGEGEIFAMGDNRANSYDSRRAGTFPQEDIFGVVPDWAYAVKGITTSLNGFFDK